MFTKREEKKKEQVEPVLAKLSTRLNNRILIDFRWGAISRCRGIQQRKSSSESAGGSSTLDRETLSSVASEPSSGWASLSSTEKVPVQDVSTGKWLKHFLFQSLRFVRFSVLQIAKSASLISWKIWPQKLHDFRISRIFGNSRISGVQNFLQGNFLLLNLDLDAFYWKFKTRWGIFLAV